MTALTEEICISALDKICNENFDSDEYSLCGEKESAVCLEKNDNGWKVYEKERNSFNDMFLFDNIVEAGLDLLKRLSTSAEYCDLKNAFFEAIIGKRTA